MKISRNKLMLYALYLILFLVLTIGMGIMLHAWFNYLDHYIDRHLDNGTFISLSDGCSTRAKALTFSMEEDYWGRI